MYDIMRNIIRKFILYALIAAECMYCITVTATATLPDITGSKNILTIRGEMQESDEQSATSLIVLKDGKNFPENSKNVAPNDIEFIWQDAYPANTSEYSFKVPYTENGDVLQARISGSNIETPITFDIDFEADTAYTRNAETVFIDETFEDIGESFENGEGSFNAYENGTTEYVSVGTEEGGNHYLKIDQTTHGHRSYGFDVPEIETGKIKICFDTYFENVPLESTSETNFWFLGKDLDSEKLLLLGTDYGLNGYGMMGKWGREDENDYDSLCFGKLKGMQWYSYETEIDLDNKIVAAKLYNRDTKELVGTARGKLGKHNGYSDGMPSGKFKYLFVRMSDQEIGIDNVKVTYFSEYPKVEASLVSANVGNILSREEAATESGELGIEYTNIENTDVTLSGQMTLYDDMKHIINSFEFSDMSVPSKSKVTVFAAEAAAAVAEKCGVYYITTDYTAKTRGGRQAHHSSPYLSFSVINKSDDNSENNKFTALCANLADADYIYTDDVSKAALKAGYKYIRTPFRMPTKVDGNFSAEVEVTKGQIMKDNGISAMAIIMTGLRNVETGERDYYSAPMEAPQEAWDQLYEWYDYIIDGNKLNAAYYEVGNEAYYGNIDGTWYAEKVLKPFWEKSEDKGSTVPIIATFTAPEELWWTNQFIVAGGLNYCDGVAVHIYDTISGSNFNDHVRTDRYYSYIASVKQKLTDEGYPDMPIYITESGQTSSLKQWVADTVEYTPGGTQYPVPDKATRRGQAAAILQSYAISASEKMNQIYTYVALERDEEKPQTEHNQEYYFGMLRHPNSDTPYGAHQAYVASAGYNALLADATYKDKLRTDDGATFIRFEKPDGSDVIICWTDYKAEIEFGMNEFNAKSIGLNLGSSEAVQVYDMYTNNIGQLNAVDGVYTISPGYEPMYLVGDFSGLTKAEPKISVTGSGRINMTDRNDMQITLTSDDTTLLNSTTSIETDGDQNIAVRNISKNDGSAEINVRFKAPAVREESVFTTKVYNEFGNMIYVGSTYLLAPPDENEQESYLSAELRVDTTSGDIIIDYNNTDLYDEDAVLFIASYKDDMLSNVSVSDVKLEMGKGSKNVEVNINGEGADYTMVFLWTKNEYSPIADPIEYK